MNDIDISEFIIFMKFFFFLSIILTTVKMKNEYKIKNIKENKIENKTKIKNENKVTQNIISKISENIHNHINRIRNNSFTFKYI